MVHRSARNASGPVFRGKTGQALQVTAVRPQLDIFARGQDWLVRLLLPSPYAIVGDELRVLQFNVCERGLQTIVGEGLLIPPAGQGRLFDILRNLADQFVGELPRDPDEESLSRQLCRELRGACRQGEGPGPDA
ncbi:hypothetical protein IV102_33790 [bacterium]|nr:hypothetical protein [bacterium]